MAFSSSLAIVRHGGVPLASDSEDVFDVNYSADSDIRVFDLGCLFVAAGPRLPRGWMGASSLGLNVPCCFDHVSVSRRAFPSFARSFRYLMHSVFLVVQIIYRVSSRIRVGYMSI